MLELLKNREVQQNKGFHGSKSYPSSPSITFQRQEEKIRPSTCYTSDSYKGHRRTKTWFKSKVCPVDGSPRFTPPNDNSMEVTSVCPEEELCVKTSKLCSSVAENSPGRKDVKYQAFTSDEDISERYPHLTMVTDRLEDIANQLKRRTSRVKELITLPPTPSTAASEKEELEAPPPPPLKQHLKTLGALEKTHSTEDLVGVEGAKKSRIRKFCASLKKWVTLPETLEPQSRTNIVWLFITCCSFFYNAWMVPMRSVFSEYQTKENLHMWFALDYSCDAIYVIDLVLFKPRIQFLKDGSWVYEPKKIKIAYLKSHRFVLDLLSLFPLDFLYFYFGPISAFRFPRLLKFLSFWEFFDRIDAVLSNPFIARLARTVLYMVYTIHLNALVYYGFSKYEGIGSNSWVFSGVGNAYVRCYYFAIKTATSIGKNPKPVNVHEQALMMVAWLAGVFVFAVLIGQVKDIVLTAAKNQDEYMRVRDQTLDYLNKFNLPQSTMDRVRLWFSFTWKTQKTLDEVKPLQFLPIKLQMDIAINVHIQTLSKVELFQDCDENLLRDLVLKLKPVIYLPGDYVCKKGEVGKEMYIVKTGEVQVVGGPTGDTVFATLSEGSVFGEISLLALAGGNRRTADVRSHGFSNLFVLSKEDLQMTIKDHPEAQKVLRRKAAKLIKQTKSREKTPLKKECESAIKIKNPKLLNAVFKTARRGSFTESLMSHSLKSKSASTVATRANAQQGPVKDESKPVSQNDELLESEMGSEDEEILVIESYDQELNTKAELHLEAAQGDDTTSYELKKDDEETALRKDVKEECENIIEKVCNDLDDWVKNIYGNPEDSLAILGNLNENIHLIPIEERVTYSLAEHAEKFPLNFTKTTPKYFHLDKELPIGSEKNVNEYENVSDVTSTPQHQTQSGLFDDFKTENISTSDFHSLATESPLAKVDIENANVFSSSGRGSSPANENSFVDPNFNNEPPDMDIYSRRKGVIDFGSPIDNDGWSIYDCDSPKSDSDLRIGNTQGKTKSVLSFGSFSSRDSFDLTGFSHPIQSFSSESEVNRERTPSP